MHIHPISFTLSIKCLRSLALLSGLTSEMWSRRHLILLCHLDSGLHGFIVRQLSYNFAQWVTINLVQCFCSRSTHPTKRTGSPLKFPLSHIFFNILKTQDQNQHFIKFVLHSHISIHHLTRIAVHFGYG